MNGDRGSGPSRDEESREPFGIDRLTLRFRDPQLEAAYRADSYRHNLGNIRFAFLGGVFLWVTWGLVLYPYLLALADKRVDLIMRYGIFIPVLLVGFALSFTRSFERIWEWVAVGVVLVTILAWVYYIEQVLTMPAEYATWA